jgi:hypothetical protein
MDNSFFGYLQQLELMAFFSGYPLVFALVLFFGGNRSPKDKLSARAYSVLPIAYTLAGALYLGLQLKNLYPDYSTGHIRLSIQQPLLVCWGLLSLLFWIPVLRKKPVLSLLHSLVFFFFVVRDILVSTFRSSADKHVLRNDMKIYTVSLLLNLGLLVLVLLISLAFSRFKKQGRRLPVK